MFSNNMNERVLFVAVTILILAGAGFVSQAYAAFTITMETDKDVYDHSSVITVTGHVDPVDPTGSEVTIIVKRMNPVGLVQVAQAPVNSDGSFSTTIETASATMKYDGMYQIKAQYVDAEITVSVELTNAIETSETGTAVTGTAVTGTAVTGPSGESLYKFLKGQIEYDLTCNATPAFFGNADDDSIVIYLDSTDDGLLTVTLHEEIIKPFEDGTFVVIVDNQEMQDYTQIGNTLTIPCLAGTEKIEIHGSWAIPEFGVIAAMILAVAIVSIIVVTAKTKLSIVPRY
jgi:predicted secreted protein with PEFG-CTERM motif